MFVAPRCWYLVTSNSFVDSCRHLFFPKSLFSPLLIFFHVPMHSFIHTYPWFHLPSTTFFQHPHMLPPSIYLRYMYMYKVIVFGDLFLHLHLPCHASQCFKFSKPIGTWLGLNPNLIELYGSYSRGSEFWSGMFLLSVFFSLFLICHKSGI